MTKMTENQENNTVEEIKTKYYYRKVVWENLEKNNMVSFPRPCYHRIPNFKGSEEAAEKILELDAFKNAQNVKVNPDKPQEPVRIKVLDNKKDLYVPIPRLSNGLLKHITIDEAPNPNGIRKIVSRNGIEEFGKDVGLEDDLNIDLVVMGSVAVSKEGYRIGKGKGFADLEFGILSQMKAVNQDTIVVTTVHDTQVFDRLPPEIFQPHDVPVDIIITPTQVIHIEKPLPKPTGIIWNILSQRRIDMMPVLKTLREMDEKAGKDVSLKENDSDTENQEPKKRFNQRFNRRKRYPKERQSSENQSDETTKKSYRRRYYNRKPRQPETENVQNEQINVSNGNKERSQKSKRNIRKKQIDFSLMVRNIERTMRVRDMKTALAERGVKPRLITWRGFKGYCCLHFGKNNVTSETDHNVDKVISMLQNLQVTPQTNKQLSIEVMKPISRIETTDVSSV